MTKNFFNESTKQSRVKSAIVAKYFTAWARIIIGAQNKNPAQEDKRIAYIDLFAGPGRYSDGTTSTPLRILGVAIKNEDIRQRLVTFFNDKDQEQMNSLEKSIGQLSDVDSLKHPPEISNQEVDETIANTFENKKLVPTLFFFDPWGYKGVTLRLLKSVLKDWGCDCIFFFNYNRINMGLNNPMVKEHMNMLFGAERADKLRRKLSRLSTTKRESTILDELCGALHESGPEYVLPFCFKNDRGTRVSHYLIFVSKNFKGYEVMKEIMAKESSTIVQGVASFEYNPAATQVRQVLFFPSRPHEALRPLDDLGDMLLKEFSGETITMRQIYKRHSVNRPYISANYKEVLQQLDQQQKITAPKHKKGTFGDDVPVTFPRLKGNEQ